MNAVEIEMSDREPAPTPSLIAAARAIRNEELELAKPENGSWSTCSLLPHDLHDALMDAVNALDEPIDEDVPGSVDCETCDDTRQQLRDDNGDEHVVACPDCGGSDSDRGSDVEGEPFPVYQEQVNMPSGESYYGAIPADAQGFARHLRWQRNVINQRDAEIDRLTRERDEARASADRWRAGEFEKLDRFDDTVREHDHASALIVERDARIEQLEGELKSADRLFVHATASRNKALEVIEGLRDQLAESNEARCKALRDLERLRATALELARHINRAAMADGGAA